MISKAISIFQAQQFFPRTLEEDLSKVKALKASSVVTLLSSEEMEILGMTHMGPAVEAKGMSWQHLDLRDKWIPWDSSMCKEE